MAVSDMKNLIPAVLVIGCLTTTVHSQDTLCPDPESIAPCYCSIDNNRPNMYCYDIESEDQLEEIFSAEYPEPNMNMLTMESSSMTEMSRDVFGNTTFENIYIIGENIQNFSIDAFKSSVDTLLYLAISKCPITEETFPFTSLNEYPNLINLELHNNTLSTFPVVVHDNLSILQIFFIDTITIFPQGALTTIPNTQAVDFTNCRLQTVEEGAFRGAEGMLSIYLHHNEIRTLLPNVFKNLTSLLVLHVYKNEISYIEPGIFSDLSSLQILGFCCNNIRKLNVTHFGGMSKLTFLDLSHNQIEVIQSGTFAWCPALTALYLDNNKLTAIVDGTFNGLGLYANIQIGLDYNSISLIQPSSFGSISNSSVNLQFNQLTSFDESWMKPLLDNNNDVFLEGNPLKCDCEIVWLFDNPSYQSQISFQCPNGTDFSDLDPGYYQQNC